ncbi:MAG: nucleotidyltransferase family protein [Candidatus Aminicenantes bacterium]|nr:nucleotidyltransferase family protein [Candidatus Aminicenantes bacterium]
MKAIILAAGKGKRLGKLTESIPKPMLKIGKKPILEHNIECLRDYGISDIYINLHHLPEVIRNYFSDGKKWGVNIQYSYEPALLGTAGAMRKIAEDYWIKKSWKKNKHILSPKRQNPFFVVYGDNLFAYNLRKIINFHERKKGVATIALYEKENVEQSGIVLLNGDNKIIKFIEKPKPGEVVSNLVNTGLYILEPKVLDYIPSNKAIDFGKDVFPEMIKNDEKIFGLILKGNLRAIDTPLLYKQVTEAS